MPKNIADEVFEKDKLKYEREYTVGRGISSSKGKISFAICKGNGRFFRKIEERNSRKI